MFEQNVTSKRNTFVFVGGFHLGIPLALINTDKCHGWNDFKNSFSTELLKYHDFFENALDEYELETKFPFGRPIILRHKKFDNFFNLPQYLIDEGFNIKKENYSCENRIWILPTGIVLIFGTISIDPDKFISLNEFEDKIVEKHYADLSSVFVHIAHVLYNIIPTEVFNSAISCKSDVDKCVSAINALNKLEIATELFSDRLALYHYFEKNESFAELISATLVDVYYFRFRKSGEKELIRIGYVDSEVISQDPSYLLVISIAYSSFVGFLWIIKHLSEQSRILQNALFGTKKLPKNISHDLKLFRIFCLQFINESSPIQIRLTGYYMNRLEECWKEFRLGNLATQVNDQLQTLVQIFDWFDETKRELRNFKIGLAAILLAMISVLAVTAQLISTIDFANTVPWKQRFFLIVLGFSFGIIFTVLIYFIPYRKNRN